MASTTHRQLQTELFAALDSAAEAAVGEFDVRVGTSFDPRRQLAEWHAAAPPYGDHWRPIRMRARS